MGSKYKFDYNENPPPGFYEPTSGIELTKPKSQATFIKEDLVKSRVPE